MTTNREVLDLNEKCGQAFGGRVIALVCGRPKGHRPAKVHRLEPTAGDLRRSLRQRPEVEEVEEVVARTLQVETVRDDSGYYLSQGWIEGKNETTSFDLTCGAGVGGVQLRLVVEHGGQSVTEVVNMASVVEAWVTAITEQIDAEAGA